MPSTLPLIPLTGTIRDPDGVRFTGTLKLTLSYAACRNTLDSEVVVARRVRYPVVNGRLPTGAVITPNDILQPANTTYLAEYVSASGGPVAKNHYYIEGDSFDIGSAQPTTVTTANISFSNIEMDAGNAMYLQAGVGAEERSVQDRLRDAVSVFDFMTSAEIAAVRDGAGAMDVTASIQTAVDALVAKGGALLFPGGMYKITSTITVSSQHPIHLLGRMDGSCVGPEVVRSGLMLGGNIAGPMIRYTAPNSADRLNCGGGNVEGLVFCDISNRGFTCTAALELNDFPLSRVARCVFQWIKGSAILGQTLIMSEISSNIIRYCGDTGKAALELPSTTGPFVAQSLRISGNRLESNYDAPYLRIGALATDVSVADNRFEASSDEIPATNQPFLVLACNYVRVLGNNFNRVNETQVFVDGRNSVVSGNLFRGGAYTMAALAVAGSLNAIVGNSFASTRTGIEVLLSGQNNTFSGNTMFFSGSIKSTAVANIIANNNIHQSQATTALLGAGDDYWINITDTALFNVVDGNVVDNNGGAVTTVGGIRSEAAVTTIANNSIRGFTGTGSGANGIRLDQNQQTVTSNLLNAAAISIGTFYDSAINSNITDGVIPLYAEAPFTPGSIAYQAASPVLTVSVPGAAVGDIVTASMNYFVDRLVLQASAGANEVFVHVLNFNPSAIDPGTVTVRVHVHKRWN